MEYFQFLIIIIFAPLVNGFFKKFKANMQGRQGPGIFQPYYDLIRLFKKELVISNISSWIFRVTPYIVFSSTLVAIMMVPVITDKVLFGNMADIIALIYILALGRFFYGSCGA